MSLLFSRKLSNYAERKLDLVASYTSLRGPLREQDDEEGNLENTFNLLLEWDELVYQYHAYKAYLELSKVLLSPQDREMVQQAEALFNAVERKLPIPNLIAEVQSLAIIRRELHENAKESGKIFVQHELATNAPPSSKRHSTPSDSNEIGPGSKRQRIRAPSISTSDPSLTVSSVPTSSSSNQSGELVNWSDGTWSQDHVRCIFLGHALRSTYYERIECIKKLLEDRMGVFISKQLISYLLLHYGLRGSNNFDVQTESLRTAFDEAYMKNEDSVHARKYESIRSYVKNKIDYLVSKSDAQYGAKFRQFLTKVYGVCYEPPQNYKRFENTKFTKEELSIDVPIEPNGDSHDRKNEEPLKRAMSKSQENSLDEIDSIETANTNSTRLKQQKPTTTTKPKPGRKPSENKAAKNVPMTPIPPVKQPGKRGRKPKSFFAVPQETPQIPIATPDNEKTPKVKKEFTKSIPKDENLVQTENTNTITSNKSSPINFHNIGEQPETYVPQIPTNKSTEELINRDLKLIYTRNKNLPGLLFKIQKYVEAKYHQTIILSELNERLLKMGLHLNHNGKKTRIKESDGINHHITNGFSSHASPGSGEVSYHDQENINFLVPKNSDTVNFNKSYQGPAPSLLSLLADETNGTGVGSENNVSDQRIILYHTIDTNSNSPNQHTYEQQREFSTKKFYNEHSNQVHHDPNPPKRHTGAHQIQEKPNSITVDPAVTWTADLEGIVQKALVKIPINAPNRVNLIANYIKSTTGRYIPEAAIDQKVKGMADSDQLESNKHHNVRRTLEDIIYKIVISMPSDEHYERKFENLNTSGFWTFDLNKIVTSTVEFLAYPQDTSTVVYGVGKDNLISLIVYRLLNEKNVSVGPGMVKNRLISMTEHDVFSPEATKFIEANLL
jgi:hypothetical protein